jgi:hypothetical protein
MLAFEEPAPPASAVRAIWCKGRSPAARVQRLLPSITFVATSIEDCDMHRTVARHASSHAAAPGAVARLAMLAALAGLLNTSWRRCREMHQRRMDNRPDSKPEKLQVWEDEGGQNQMPAAPP